MMNSSITRSMAYFILFSIFYIQTTLAQKLDSTTTVAVVPFKMGFENTKDDKDYSKIIAEGVFTAIEQSKRFKSIDRTDFNAIRNEIALQSGENKEEFTKWTSDQEAMIRYGKRLRADYILTGTISNVDATTSLVTGAYSGIIGFTIKMIDVNTSQVPVSESFEVNSGKNPLKVISSRDAAISKAITEMSEPIKKFVDKYFPIYAKYVRTEDTSKRGEMTKVVINKGSENGFRISQKLIIIIDNNNINKDTKGTKIPPQDIGEAEIIDIQPEYSTVKIKSQKKNLETMPNKLEVLYFRSKSN